MGLGLFNPIEVMSPVLAEQIKNRRNTSFYKGPCDYCKVGDHGRCWRSICHCKHRGWKRDVNAQVPHGLAAGFSKDTKFYGAKKRKKRKDRIENHRRRKMASYALSSEARFGA